MNEETPLFCANYHTHTPRCHHATGSEREYIETAIRAGMTTLGFSDHAPAVFPGNFHSNFRMDISEAEEYYTCLSELREEYKSDIRIVIGYEMEYYPVLFSSMLRGVCACPIDYLILGQHFLESEVSQIYSGSPTMDESRLKQYISQVLTGLSTGAFSYLAHPDLIQFVGDETVYEKHMRQFCGEIKNMHIPLEINFLGLCEERAYPSARFFKIAKEVGNHFIYGCDAHEPELLADRQVRQKAKNFAEKLHLQVSQELTLKNPRSALH